MEQRPANRNFWGYNQTYGLGYMEYFQLAEDIGAPPVPVVPVGVTGCGDNNRAPTTRRPLDRYIQDTLDLIEFANGDASTTWGAKRDRAAATRSPSTWTALEVGNEENKPEVQAVLRPVPATPSRRSTRTSRSSPTPARTTRARSSTTCPSSTPSAKVDMVDEHYYNDPTWFLNNNHRYDSYDRNGPKVFLGEYASLGNKPANALAEASYMTGLERNADVVKMASYAPLIANEANVQWPPGHDLVRQRNLCADLPQLRGPEAVHDTTSATQVVPSDARTTRPQPWCRLPGRSGCPPGPPPPSTTM